jgi:hypothetical protein
MLKRRPKGDGEEGQIFGTHPGDLGIIVIAGLCTVALFLMLVLPSPFAAMHRQEAEAVKMEAQAAKQARQKEIDKAVATGVVSVGIPAAKRP